MKVCPTKSGVTIERRAQVFTGFFTPDAFILSIFSRRCPGTNGPFFSDLAITKNYFFRLSFMINRSLGLCFARVSYPFASCPHGLTGGCRPPPPCDLPWPPPLG